MHLSLSSFAISAFPEIMAGRLPHHVFRGLLSVHSRYGLHTHQVTFMTLYTGGFSRFVTFTTAPIATGWNESCRAGFAPAGKPCLCTAHMIKDVIIRWFGWRRQLTFPARQEISLGNFAPFPFPPRGKAGVGGKPPRRRSGRLPLQEGFQSALLKTPLLSPKNV